MHSDTYEGWFHDKLLSNILERSIIVTNNASCNSRKVEKVPTANTRKSKMKDWLMVHDTVYPECMSLNCKLLSSIHLSNHKTMYVHVIDQMAKASGL